LCAPRSCAGGYKLLDWKLPDYLVPDLKGFEVRAAGRLAPACGMRVRARAARGFWGTVPLHGARAPRLTPAPCRRAQLKPYVSYNRAPATPPKQ
jgi:hypothetical protein